MKLHLVIIVMALILPFRLSIACEDTVPLKKIVDIVTPLAYADFPRVQDI